VTSIVIDLKKAFDTVNYNILLQKLDSYGLRGHINSSQKLPHKPIPICPIPIMLLTSPTGSMWSATRLSPWTNPISPIHQRHAQTFSHNIPLIFADDTTLTFIANSLQILNMNINEDLANLYIWLAANKLTLNINKTNYISYSHPQTVLSPLSIFINQQEITSVRETPILGVIIDQHLTFKSHIFKVKNKLASSLFIFTKIRHQVPNQIAWSLYHSIFKPHLTYCLLVWGNTHASYLHPLNVLHNKFLRNLLFLPNRTSSSMLYHQASVLPLQSLYKFFVAIVIYKFFNLPDTLPPTIQSIFQASSHMHNHSTRNMDSLGLYHFPNSINLRHNHISISGPQIWNSIPLHIKTLPTISQFKKHLHLNLLHSAN